MSRAKEISRDTVVFSVGQYISQFLNVAREFLVAKYLGPYYLGVWGTVILIQSYVHYSTLGTIFAMNREVPFLRAKGETDRVRTIEETTRTFVLGVSMLICIGVLIYSVLNTDNLSVDVLTGMRVIGISLILRQLTDFYFGYLRARSSFRLLVIAQVAGAALGLLVMLVLGSQYKINASYIALIVSYAIPLMIILFKQKHSLELRLHPRVMRFLFTLGISLLIYNLAALIYRTADRWLVLKLLTTEDMGYYHFVTRIIQGAILIPSAFSSVLYPRMMEMYGARGQKEDLRKVVYVSSSLISLVSPIVLVSVYYSVQFVIRFYLPEYEPIMSFFAILMLGIQCGLSGSGTATFLLATNRQNVMTLILGMATAIKIAVGYGLVRSGYGLVGVALGTVVGYFFMSVYYIFWVFKSFEATNWLVLRRFLRLYAPLPIMLASLWISSRLAPVLVHGTSMATQAGQVIVQLVAFYLLFGPSAYVLADRDRHLRPYLNKGRQLLRRRCERAIGRI